MISVHNLLKDIYIPCYCYCDWNVASMIIQSIYTDFLIRTMVSHSRIPSLRPFFFSYRWLNWMELPVCQTYIIVHFQKIQHTPSILMVRSSFTDQRHLGMFLSRGLANTLLMSLKTWLKTAELINEAGQQQFIWHSIHLRPSHHIQTPNFIYEQEMWFYHEVVNTALHPEAKHEGSCKGQVLAFLYL